MAELEVATSGELVELAHAALAVLAARPAPQNPTICLETAERLGAALDLGEAALAGLVGRADAAAEPLRQRFAGTRGWLTVGMGMRGGRASERLAVARQLPHLPRTAGSLSAGKLPYGYGATICMAVARLSDEDALAAERILLDAALEGVSATKVAKLGERIVQVIAERDGIDDPGRDARRGARSWLRLSRYLGGRGAMRADLDPELTTLLADRLAPLAKPAGPEDTRDQAERNADALRMLLTGGGTGWNATLVIALTDDGAGNDADARADTSACVDVGACADASARAEVGGYADVRVDSGPHTDPHADAGTFFHASVLVDADTLVGADVDGRGMKSGAVRKGLAPALPPPDAGELVEPVADGGVRIGPEAEGEFRFGTGDRALEGRGRVPVWPLENLAGGWRIRARLADGTPITSKQARIIALNAGISALILGSDGHPLYLGRTARFVTPAQRRALEALYETCGADECDIPARMCQLDHVFNWAEDGTTDIDRLAPACAFHNRLKYTHPEWFTISRAGSGRWRYTIRRPRPRWNRRAQAQGP